MIGAGIASQCKKNSEQCESKSRFGYDEKTSAIDHDLNSHVFVTIGYIIPIFVVSTPCGSLFEKAAHEGQGLQNLWLQCISEGRWFKATA
jgi:hypothetical protein